MDEVASVLEVGSASATAETHRCLSSVPLLACTTGYEAVEAGCKLTHSIAINSRGRAIFDVNEDFRRLECSVAISAAGLRGGSKADFVVLADGREVAATRRVTAGDPARPLAAELGRARTLELRVQTNQLESYQATWIDPMLLPNPPSATAPMVGNNGRTLPGEYRLAESRMTELEALSIGLNTDKATIHSYLPYYGSVFESYRQRLRAGGNVAMLEIGVFGGGSIHLWRDYFGPQLEIQCFDLNIPGNLPRGTSLHLGSACDKTFVQSRFPGASFDLIIDDGSHYFEEQISTFLLLEPYLKPGGLFIIEDIQSMAFISRIEAGTSTKFELVDLRENKNRYDDVLLVYTKARRRDRKSRRDNRKPV